MKKKGWGLKGQVKIYWGKKKKTLNSGKLKKVITLAVISAANSSMIISCPFFGPFYISVWGGREVHYGLKY